MKIPQAFTDGVLRERGDAGQIWIDALPETVDRYCRLWNLKIDGALMHGYIGLVVPVLQGNRKCVLKVSWLDDETRYEGTALLAWQGNGAVLALNADNQNGVLLLERLDFNNSLSTVEINAATEIAGKLLRRLAISAPKELSHTSDFARRQASNLLERWERVGRPFSASLLEESIEYAERMVASLSSYLVNQDLHFDNVLRGLRETWLVIDPKPIAGDIEFGVAPLLWNRTREGNVSERMEIILSSGDLNKEKFKTWTQLRIVDYWLWALEQGFTKDPEVCRFLIDELKTF